LIEVTDLRKSFFTPAGELQILKGIDLSIERGEVLAIVGASGVGKSTLLHILGTLDRPTSGSVTYDATDVFALPDAELTSFRNTTVGFVFQFHHLMPEFTALENVMMPLLIGGETNRAASEERAAALLTELGLGHRLHHRPGELSGGEQQRAAVARALILNPRVVLADEPTGNLDSGTGDELFSLLLRLNRERSITFIIVTHNESLSGQCRRVVEMVDGMVRPLVRG
jgi:lipoprotein-releasing system ATP-binding protein